MSKTPSKVESASNFTSKGKKKHKIIVKFLFSFCEFVIYVNWLNAGLWRIDYFCPIFDTNIVSCYRDHDNRFTAENTELKGTSCYTYWLLILM